MPGACRCASPASSGRNPELLGAITLTASRPAQVALRGFREASPGPRRGSGRGSSCPPRLLVLSRLTRHRHMHALDPGAPVERRHRSGGHVQCTDGRGDSFKRACVEEGVVIGVERAVGGDGEFAALRTLRSATATLKSPSRRPLAQRDQETVGLAARKLCPVVALGTHGIDTSLTRIAVVGAATKKGSNASASSSLATLTRHQIACPPVRHDAMVVCRRSELS